MSLSAMVALLFTLVLSIPSGGSAAAEPDPPPRPSGGAGVAASDLPALLPLSPLRTAGAPATSNQALEFNASAAAAAPSPPPGLAFDGIINTTVDITPPDTHIAVGPGAGATGRVVMVTNLSAAIWDKQGVAVGSELLLDTMFGADVFDPKVLYDQHSGRFFVVALEGKNTTPGTSIIHIAVSADGLPSDLTSSWTFSSGSAVTTLGGSSTWADYPGIGADASALFVTTNQFTFPAPVTPKGLKIRVFDKSALAAGVYSYVDIDSTSAGTTQPAHVFGATANGDFYLVRRINPSSFRLTAVSGHPGAPVATSGDFTWAAGAYPTAPGADQCGVANPTVDTLRSRVQNAVYRDGQIWLAGTSDPDVDGQTEVYWQQIATNAYPSANPTNTQSGFIDGTGTAPWTYLPAISVNAAGAAAIVYTQSSATECPNMNYVTREPGDAAGSFRASVQARASAGFYDSYKDSDPDRWGDYAAVVIDPDDGCFWLAHEFVYSSAVAASDWGTHVANVCVPLHQVPAMHPSWLPGLGLLLGISALLEYRRRLPS